MQDQQVNNSITLRILYFAILLSMLPLSLVLFITHKTSMEVMPVIDNLLYIIISLAVIVVFVSYIFETKANSAGKAQIYFTFKLLTWALCESIAVQGFVLSFISGSLVYHLIFSSVALFFFFLYRPDIHYYERLLNHYKP